MAVIKSVKIKKGNISNLEDYVMKGEKTEERLVTGIECTPGRIEKDFHAIKEIYNKTEGRQYAHIVQSFKPGEVDSDTAHKIGVEFAKENFEGYQCLISTHTDKDHTHNHFIINSVNMESGKKWQLGKPQLQEIKNKNDDICKEYNLSVPEKNKNRYFSQAEIQLAEKGESWKFRLMGEIDLSKENTTNREDFIKNMNDKNYEVKWTDTRKYITYTTPTGQKCRDSKLPNKYSKEEIMSGFKENDRQEHGGKSREEDRFGIRKSDSQKFTSTNIGTDDRTSELGNIASQYEQDENGNTGNDENDDGQSKERDRLVTEHFTNIDSSEGEQYQISGRDQNDAVSEHDGEDGQSEQSEQEDSGNDKQFDGEYSNESGNELENESNQTNENDEKNKLLSNLNDDLDNFDYRSDYIDTLKEMRNNEIDKQFLDDAEHKMARFDDNER